MNIFNYDLISTFNEINYDKLLFPSNINGDEVYINEAKEKSSQAISVKEYFYPLKKGRKNYLLPSKYLNHLPIHVDDTIKISFDKKAYYLIRECHPAGFGAEKTFATFRDFVDTFCNYSHTHKEDFLLWKFIVLTSYFKRINCRVSTSYGFGKDSVLRVVNGFMGDISIIHNPTLPKIEYLLTSKVLVTNEVADISDSARRDLQNYFLMCGDFSNSYLKRSRATKGGSQEEYDISRLSNIVCYNHLEHYNEEQRKNFFDNVFQDAVLDRFIPFRFDGHINEVFSDVLDKPKVVEENMDKYKAIVKMFKYMSQNYHLEVKQWKHDEYGFKGRLLRNWNTICATISMYAESQKEYDELCSLLYQKYLVYKMVVEKPKLNQNWETLQVEEEKM